MLQARTHSNAGLIAVLLVAAFVPATATGQVPGVDPLCVAGSFSPKPDPVVGVSTSLPGLEEKITPSLLAAGAGSVIFYSHDEIAAGAPIADGVDVLHLLLAVTVGPAPPGYRDGIRALVASGASVIANYDGAALLFDEFEDIVTPSATNFAPSVGLFSGRVRGGGALVRGADYTIHFIDPAHPLAAGMGPTFGQIALAFSIDSFDSEWLHVVGTFDSSGWGGLNPAGTFPAILGGRCGGGRVAVVTQLMFSSPTVGAQQLLTNALNFVTGVTNPNTAPIADAGPDQVVECTGSGGASLTLNGLLSSDSDGDPLTYSWTGPFGPEGTEQTVGTTTADGVFTVTVPNGTHEVTLVVMDTQGETSSDTLQVTVRDTTAPTIAAATASADTLWPPDHRMEDIDISVDVSDLCDSSISAADCRIVSVSSNEPDDGVGDGSTWSDWTITGPLSLQLRAERAGEGTGRVYTIVVTCTDASGNETMRSLEVRVPRNQTEA